MFALGEGAIYAVCWEVSSLATAICNTSLFQVAMKRVRSLLELEYDVQAEKKGNDVMWAVFEAFSK